MKGTYYYLVCDMGHELVSDKIHDWCDKCSGDFDTVETHENTTYQDLCKEKGIKQ